VQRFSTGSEGANGRNGGQTGGLYLIEALLYGRAQVEHMQQDSKILSVISFVGYGNPDNNLESPCNFKHEAVEKSAFVLRMESYRRRLILRA
jgi:hypothetical protein